MLPLPRTGSMWATPNSTRLEGDRRDHRDATQQAAQHEPAEHELLDERRGDDGRQQQRDDVGAIGVDVADAFGVPDERDAGQLDDEQHRQLASERGEPDESAPIRHPTSGSAVRRHGPDDRCPSGGWRTSTTTRTARSRRRSRSRRGRAAGQPRPANASSRYRLAISEAISTATAPTATGSGSVGWASASRGGVSTAGGVGGPAATVVVAQQRIAVRIAVPTGWDPGRVAGARWADAASRALPGPHAAERTGACSTAD